MYIPEGSYHSDRDYELESLLRQISELELETRGRCRRRSPEWSSHDRSLVSSHLERLLHQSHSWLLRDRLNESKDGDSVSLKREKGTPICCHERHKPSSKKDSPVAFFKGKRTHRDAETLHSPIIHLLQWQDESDGARKLFHPTYGSLFSE